MQRCDLDVCRSHSFKNQINFVCGENKVACRRRSPIAKRLEVEHCAHSHAHRDRNSFVRQNFGSRDDILVDSTGLFPLPTHELIQTGNVKIEPAWSWGGGLGERGR